jgi:hypothetical protein
MEFTTTFVSKSRRDHRAIQERPVLPDAVRCGKKVTGRQVSASASSEAARNTFRSICSCRGSSSRGTRKSSSSTGNRGPGIRWSKKASDGDRKGDLASVPSHGSSNTSTRRTRCWLLSPMPQTISTPGTHASTANAGPERANARVIAIAKVPIAQIGEARKHARRPVKAIRASVQRTCAVTPSAWRSAGNVNRAKSPDGSPSKSSSVPRWACTTSATMDNPSPNPALPSVLAAFSLKNGSNTLRT